MKRKRSIIVLLSQRGIVTAELFSKNELANHAAAGAYGFLLSAAPAVLIAALIMSKTLRSSPEGVSAFMSSLQIFGSVVDAKTLAASFLAAPLTGISGLIAVANLIWTARVFALALQRGIRVVFPSSKKASPIRDNIVTFAVEFAALAYAILYLLSSRFVTALALTNEKSLWIQSSHAVLGLVIGALPFVGLFVLTYWAFRGLPDAQPHRKAAFEGALFCVLAYTLVSIVFRSLVNLSRYDLVYGVLGGLIVALANVYFFFMFFFLGAQLCFVVDSFDSLIFSRFRRFSTKGDTKKNGLERRLFAAPERLLSKYSRSYATGDILFSKGESDRDIYFILSGEVGIFLDDPGGEKKLARIPSGSFLGEMAYLLSEPRTASARAESDTVVLKLPPELFERVLDADPETARYVIGSLSQRLKKTNERIGAA